MGVIWKPEGLASFPNLWPYPEGKFLKFQTLGEYERRKPQCVPLTNASEKALLVQTPP